MSILIRLYEPTSIPAKLRIRPTGGFQRSAADASDEAVARVADVLATEE